MYKNRGSVIVDIYNSVIFLMHQYWLLIILQNQKQVYKMQHVYIFICFPYFLVVIYPCDTESDIFKVYAMYWWILYKTIVSCR